MFLSRALPQSDMIGALASGLCVVHCVATPFLFVAHTCAVTGCCTTSPGWWSAMDYFFIGITFLAVFFSAKNSSKAWIPPALYGSWLVLTLLVINEKTAFVPLAELWKYGAAFVLVGLHLYNRRYCQCGEEGCATEAVPG
jgi:hypothetical protein